MHTGKLLLGLTLGLLLIDSAPRPAQAVEFHSGNLRGRYTGHLNIGASFSDGTNTYRLDVQLLTALTFDGKSIVEGASRVTLTLPGEPPRTRPFAVTGTYQVEESGLGTATLVLTSSDQTCEGGVTLNASLLVGGVHRRRLDVTIDGATEGNGSPLPIVGAGTLEK